MGHAGRSAHDQHAHLPVPRRRVSQLALPERIALSAELSSYEKAAQRFQLPPHGTVQLCILPRPNSEAKAAMADDNYLGRPASIMLAGRGAG